MKTIDDFSIERLKEISEFELRKTSVDGFEFYPDAYSKVYSSEIVALAMIAYELKKDVPTSHGIRIKGKTE
ncbi:hypothetical protein A9993_07710 [Rahnella victoriana]|uniref:hypothetical protein n=1 Tax=Rahnella victoriana TaxID=1510570 RepID=UPI000BB1E5E5|nr:hypothetical protein [Rahnella victoriana]PBI79630.1 hypothetical protein A9993_07710 [Rahnella victoriana]